MATAQLVGLTGEFAGQVFPLKETLVVGRMDSADLRIPNLEVSRRHCQIERGAEGFSIRDLGSRSGTRINDQPVETARLRPGDLIAIGPHVFRFEEGSGSKRSESILATMAVDESAGQVRLKEIRLHDFNLASQLASVSEDSTLQRLRRHLEIAQGFAEAIQMTLNTSALMELTLDELFRVFTKMDAGVIFLQEAAEQAMSPVAIRRRRKIDSGPVGYSTTILKFVESEQKAVLNVDISRDSRFQHAASVQMGSMRTHMCVPLIVRGEVVGAIYLVAEGLDDTSAGFDADDLSLLTALSGTVAVCVKNAALAREAQRNAQLSASLQRYVSADVTRRLIEQGIEGALGARMADGVAMFCDLVGFTTLSEQLPPDRIAKLLNRYFRRALEIVFAHDGSVNKFGGDSFLAVWGAIDPEAVDLTRIARAALEVQNDNFRLSSELAAEGLGTIQLTIGLNRGRFFAGDIGSDDRMEFTVIGDTVNVASRIQALAHGGQVLTTLESLSDSRERMSLALYSDVPIRGRASGVTIASIRSLLEADTRQGPRLLASIPVQITGIDGPALVVGALLGEVIELEVLVSRAAEPGRAYVIAPTLPERAEPIAPAKVVCNACVAEPPIFALKLRVTEPSELLSSLLTPGAELNATQPLRQKS